MEEKDKEVKEVSEEQASAETGKNPAQETVPDTNKRSKSKKKLIIGLTAAVVAAGCISAGTYWYTTDQKKHTDASNEALSVLNVQLLKDKDTVEYSKNSPLDALTFVKATNGDKTDDDLQISADPSTVDPSAVGKVEIKYTVTDKDSYGKEVSKDFTCTVNVKDTTNPIIEVNQDTYDLTVGDTFDSASVIKSVKDPVDGDLSKVDTVSETAAGYYTITSNVDTGTAGTYKVTIDAADKNGNKVSKDVAVNVADQAVVEETPSNSGTDNGYSYSGSSNGYSGSGSSSAAESGSSNASSGNSGSGTAAVPEAPAQPAAPAQSICLSGQEAAKQGADALWADENTKAGRYTVLDADGDGCFYGYLNNGSYSVGED
jgi:hypothetical protein